MPRFTRRQLQKFVLSALIIFSVALLAFVLSMNISAANRQRKIIEESVSAQLIITCEAALEVIDVDAFASYNSQADADADKANYDATLKRLRSLCKSADAAYIYALKVVDGEVLFVFDTDEEDPEVFIPYEISDVHKTAFNGGEVADLMNVEDEYGSFNTGAIPIKKDGNVIGIIATDTYDTYIEMSITSARNNTILLIAVLTVLMISAIIFIFNLFNSVTKMQNYLANLAHNDTVTSLPNRRYLIDTLENMTARHDLEPFALFFIDLDNFKSVNDNAGHDAGDDALRQIGQFLQRFSIEYVTEKYSKAVAEESLAARIGGDEFVLIFPKVKTEAEVMNIAQAMLDAFDREPFTNDIRQFGVSLSIGIALYPTNSTDYNTLIKMADASMYISKSRGKNGYSIFKGRTLDFDDPKEYLIRAGDRRKTSRD